MNVPRETFDWKQWFSRYGLQKLYAWSPYEESNVEDLYTAFKARYQAETYGNRPVEPFDATPTGSVDVNDIDAVDMTIHDSIGDVE